MFELRKSTISGKTLAHFEFYGCNMSQKNWDEGNKTGKISGTQGTFYS